ncbi:hypothetical protein GQ473_00355 [archaeon]|nr:hypothetical protein [archaeon]
MVTKLGKFELNTKKWRIENGLTGSEWKIFVENRGNILVVVVVLVSIAFFILGYTCPF